MIFIIDIQDFDKVENKENFMIFNFNTALEYGINIRGLYDISNKLANMNSYNTLDFDIEYTNAIMNNIDDFKKLMTIMYYHSNGVNVIILIDNRYDDGYTIEALTKFIKERYQMISIYDYNIEAYTTLYNKDIYDVSVTGIYNLDMDMNRFFNLLKEEELLFMSRDIDSFLGVVSND